MLPEITKHDLEAALDAIVGMVLADADVIEPPIDAFAVARGLGIDVVRDRQQLGRARFVQVGSERRNAEPCGGTIFLRPEPRRERRQWAVAHEVGERWAYRVFEGLGVDAEETPMHTREQVANLLAGRLLLPMPWFSTDGAVCGWDLLELKSRYETASHELIARRMLDFDPPIIISIYDQGQLTMRRSNVTGHVPGPSPAEHECWQYAHRQSAEYHVSDSLAEVQAWPIHESDWKREIVRATAEMFVEGAGAETGFPSL